jgi:hypothetical protein
MVGQRLRISPDGCGAAGPAGGAIKGCPELRIDGSEVVAL